MCAETDKGCAAQSVLLRVGFSVGFPPLSPHLLLTHIPLSAPHARRSVPGIPCFVSREVRQNSMSAEQLHLKGGSYLSYFLILFAQVPFG